MFRRNSKAPKTVNGIFVSFTVKLKSGQSLDLDFREMWDHKDQWMEWSATDQIQHKMHRFAVTDGLLVGNTLYPPHSIESVTFTIQDLLVKEIQ